MTEKDKIIQELRQENDNMKRELSFIVGCCRLCRFCAFVDADCSPTDTTCKPKWRGE